MILTEIDLTSLHSLLPWATAEECRKLKGIIARDSPAGLAATASGGRWMMAPHLEVLNRKLVDVAESRINRLIVSMPPRSGKSELISKYLPAWYLGRYPDRRIILTSHESDFAASWGRKVRDIIDEHGREIFGIAVRPDSSASNRWDIAGRAGGMITAGVGGAITGRGANILVIDDYLKNAQEAHSPTVRENHREWWRSTAYTRLEPGGAAVIVATRWGNDDLIGWLIKEEPETWEVINFPALAGDDDPLGREPGEALWPERFDRAKLLEIKGAIGSRWFSSLYQGSPQPDEGGLFKRHWFTLVDASPAQARRVRFWDLASATGDTSDYTAGIKMAASAGGIYTIEDVVHGRWTPHQRDEVMLQTAHLDGTGVHVYVEQEPGSAGLSVVAAAVRLLSGFVIRGDRPTGDKATRAGPLAAQCEAGNVRMLRAAWNRDAIEELITFPLAEHDDIVDGCSGAFNKLAEAVAPATVGSGAHPFRNYRG